MNLTRRFAIACLGAFAAASMPAQEQPQASAAFTAPQAYPEDRYEASWSKNPFTLKTAPAAVENVSFAKDLAIASHYGEKANPTIVIVNTKTHERTRLKKGGTASNGMRLTDFKLGETRKEMTVEVVLGSETTELKYNPEYTGQVAAAGGAGAKPVPGMPVNPGMRPGGMPVPGMPPGAQQRLPTTNGVQPRIQLPNAGGARPAGVTSSPPQQQRGSAVGMGGGINAAVVPQAGGTNINMSLNPAGNPVQSAGPLVSDANPNAPPVPVRRRLISAPTNQQTLPQ